VSVARESIDRTDRARRLLASPHFGDSSVVEYAAKCTHPRPCWPKAKGVRPSSIRGDHTSNGAEIPARWIDGKAEPVRSRSTSHVGA